MSSVFGRRSRSDRTGVEPVPAPDARTALRATDPAQRPAPAAAPSAAPLVLDGRYEVGRVLGAGGMASVHAARDLLLGREVAVKLFRREASSSPDLRLQELEARVVASLSHSALTTLLDAGVDGSDSSAPQIYLVMEYVRGETLKERLRRGPMEVSEACWLGFDLAEGLDYMHESGFLHRDVKPANILISNQRSARPVVAKLTDFGIAAAIGQPDLSEYTVGTAAYLSPEQVEGYDARPESDVYSLGIVLLEAITGQVAFPGTVEDSAFARLVRDPVVPPEVPAPVADLLRRMTARTPEHRVALHQAAVELQQFLVDDLVRRRIGAAAPVQPAADAEASRGGGPLATGAPLGAAHDGGPDAVFDALLALVARAVAAPKALLLLEHGSEATVAAQVGWTTRLTTADLAAPPLAPIDGDGPWSLPDTAEHPPVGLLPRVREDLRAAAGAPVLAHDGRRIGTVAVFDHRPRTFDDGELGSLADAARLAAHEIELRGVVRRAAFG